MSCLVLINNHTHSLSKLKTHPLTLNPNTTSHSQTERNRKGKNSIKIKMSIVPCSNTSLKRKFSSSPTNSPSPSLSSSPVRSVTMSLPGGHHHHRSTLDFFLDNEFRSSREDLYKAMPQNPHFNPLDNYCEGIRGGIKAGLDVAFTNIAQKLVNLGSNPVELSRDEVQEELVATLTELEEMGYDCAKLWERFDTLRALSVREQAASLKMEETISMKKDKQVKAAFTDTKISQLESELEKLEEASKIQEEEIEAVMSTEKCYIEESESILQKFRSATENPETRHAKSIYFSFGKMVKVFIGYIHVNWVSIKYLDFGQMFVFHLNMGCMLPLDDFHTLNEVHNLEETSEMK